MDGLDVSLVDTALLEELTLLIELVAEASRSSRRLTSQRIDELLAGGLLLPMTRP
ncbi:MAG: hypothetical protein ACXVWU_06600 [Nocardioides sp.]